MTAEDQSPRAGVGKTLELPPLPAPAFPGSLVARAVACSTFTADQMRDYARDALAVAPAAPSAPAEITDEMALALVFEDSDTARHLLPVQRAAAVARGRERFAAMLAAAPAVPAPAAILGPKLFDFATHGHWVMYAQDSWKRAGVRPEHTVCIDAKGRHCFIGRDFRIAKEDDAFPVTAYLRRADLAPELGIQAPVTVAGSQP